MLTGSGERLSDKQILSIYVCCINRILNYKQLLCLSPKHGKLVNYLSDILICMSHKYVFKQQKYLFVATIKFQRQTCMLHKCVSHKCVV